jgi:hypothetical protein
VLHFEKRCKIKGDERRVFIGAPKSEKPFKTFSDPADGKLVTGGCFGLYVLPCREASLDMKNPTRHYIW